MLEVEKTDCEMVH